MRQPAAPPSVGFQSQAIDARKSSCCAMICLHVLQTYEDVLEWPEPEAGGRAILSVGELSIMSHLPAAAALPPPAPAEEFDMLAQLVRSSSGGGGGEDSGPESMHGAFFEVIVKSVNGKCDWRRWCAAAAAVAARTWVLRACMARSSRWKSESMNGRVTAPAEWLNGQRWQPLRSMHQILEHKHRHCILCPHRIQSWLSPSKQTPSAGPCGLSRPESRTCRRTSSRR